jgi:hypothetical protein
VWHTNRPTVTGWPFAIERLETHVLGNSARKLFGPYPTNHNTNSRKVPLLSQDTRDHCSFVPIGNFQRLSSPRLANLWHADPICLFYFFYPTSVSTHISDRTETVYELPFLPNNTASETLLHKSGAVRSVYWIFTVGLPAWWYLREYVTSNNTFYNLLF